MKNLKVFLTGLLLSSFAQAGTISEALTAKDWHWVSTLSGGVSWENAGQTQTFYLAPEIEKTFTTNKTTENAANGELFLGLQKNLPHALQGQVGLAIAAASRVTLSGNIWDDADPTFNNYNYSYHIQHTHLALKGKLLVDRGYWLMPWVSASVGIGFNDAYGFSNTPTISEAVAMSDFSSNTQTSFTYTIGIGTQKSLNENWQAGIGYEFADWGKSQLGKAPGQTFNSGLSLSHLYTNSLMFNLTYIV